MATVKITLCKHENSDQKFKNQLFLTLGFLLNLRTLAECLKLTFELIFFGVDLVLSSFLLLLK